MKRVVVTSVFPADMDTIWNRLTRVETLQYIAAPLATFTPLSEDTAWEESASMLFRLRIFGFVPLRVHRIHVRRFDSDEHVVHTEESNRWVLMWNHTILLKPANDDSTAYTDIIDIEAGWRTGFVSLWSRWFYRHRQRKWRKLLRS